MYCSHLEWFPRILVIVAIAAVHCVVQQHSWHDASVEAYPRFQFCWYPTPTHSHRVYYETKWTLLKIELPQPTEVVQATLEKAWWGRKNWHVRARWSADVQWSDDDANLPLHWNLYLHRHWSSTWRWEKAELRSKRKDKQEEDAVAAVSRKVWDEKDVVSV